MGTPADPGTVGADELLMRKVPAGTKVKPLQFNPDRPVESPLGVTLLAFKPTDNDQTGLSVSRMRSDDHPDFLTIEAFAARACAGKSPEKLYYIVVLSAGRLMDIGGLAFTLSPEPVAGDDGHTLIPQLHSTLDKPTRTSLALTLAREYCVRVVGPYNCDGRVADRFIDWPVQSMGDGAGSL